MAQATFEATTQICVKLFILPFSRRYRTDLLLLRLHWPTIKCFTYTFFAGVKSRMVNACAWILTNGKYMYIHAMKIKKEVDNGIQTFTEDVGIPGVIISYNASKQTGHSI